MNYRTEELEEMAYSMQEAYRDYSSRKEAVSYIAKQYPEIEMSIFEAMWHAIDAYVDVNS